MHEFFEDFEHNYNRSLFKNNFQQKTCYIEYFSVGSFVECLNTLRNKNNPMTAALKQQKNRNTVLNLKMRGFEMASSPEAYSEPCQTSKMDIFKK